VQITWIHSDGSGDGRPTAADLRAVLEAHGHTVHLRKKQQNWRKALQRPADLVLVSGGDGTVKNVAAAVAETDHRLAVLPLGTANNIAKSLHSIGHADELVAGWEHGTNARLDVGRVRSPSREARFVEGVGGGPLATLLSDGVDEVEHAASALGHQVDRALSVLARRLREAEARHWDVILDGEDLSGRYLAVEALNIRMVGPNLPLAPKADFGDGLLDLVLVGEGDRSRLVRYVEGRISHQPGSLPTLDVRRGMNLMLRPEHGVAMHVDDDPWRRKGPAVDEPLHVALDRHLTVLVPHREGQPLPRDRGSNGHRA
jgi:diacylglycerol kinase family enzyme